MSPLAMIKRSMQRQQRLSDAQMTHLRSKAYRGIAYEGRQGEPIHARLTYRGMSYEI